jgi:hypothetical protein
MRDWKTRLRNYYIQTAIKGYAANTVYTYVNGKIDRSLTFLGQAEGPEASTETRPPDL